FIPAGPGSGENIENSTPAVIDHAVLIWTSLVIDCHYNSGVTEAPGVRASHGIRAPLQCGKFSFSR
ncbi:MAG TPA: hypothetical protein VMW51_04985, partial [Terriglobia bacterium]|nr:hypothetical protein [Terriglobia bacterium]